MVACARETEPNQDKRISRVPDQKDWRCPFYAARRPARPLHALQPRKANSLAEHMPGASSRDFHRMAESPEALILSKTQSTHMLDCADYNRDARDSALCAGAVRLRT